MPVAGCSFSFAAFSLSAAAVKTGFLLSAAAAVANKESQARIQSAAAGAAAAAASGATGATKAAAAAVVVKAAAVARAATVSRATSFIARGGALWGLAGVGAGVALSSAGFFCQVQPLSFSGESRLLGTFTLSLVSCPGITACSFLSRLLVSHGLVEAAKRKFS